MPEEAYWNPLVPELTVRSLEASLRFYAAVGFGVRFRRDRPAFAYLELGQAQLMLEEQHGEGWDVGPLVAAVHLALQALGVQPFRGIEDSWYAVSPYQLEGQREFLAQDPDGYLMRFCQYLGTRRAA